MITTGQKVRAQNPGGRAVEGTLVGWETTRDYTVGLVRWVGEGVFSHETEHVGRFDSEGIVPLDKVS